MNKRSSLFFILLFLVVSVGVAGGWYFWMRLENLNSTLLQIKLRPNRSVADNQIIIQNALDKAENYQKQGAFDVAFLFYTNALNHFPGDMKVIDELVENTIKSKDLMLASKAKEILEVMTYQVLPDDINQILSYIADIDILMSEISNNSVAHSEMLADFEPSIEDLDMEKIWQTPSQVSQTILELETFIDRVVDINNGNSSMQNVTQQLTVLYSIEQVSPMCEYIENCITNLKTGEENGISSISYYESLLMAINSELLKLWGMNIENLPLTMKTYLNEIPDRVDLITNELKKRISKEPYEEILKIFSEIEQINKKNVYNYTFEINKINELLNSVQVLFPQVTFEDFQIALQKRFKDINLILQKMEIERFAEYQRRAARLCQRAMNYYQDQKIFSDKKAMIAYERFDLGKIDQSILSPETSMCFNFVIQKILGELPAKEAFLIQKSMVETKKYKLEDI